MNELSVEYTKAVDLDRRIKVSAQLAQQNLYEVCKGLKEMHDSKLYKELGYSSFEKYTEDEVGIKRHQAQKYVVAIDANIENGDSSHHFERIGVTKLALLAKLDEPQQEEIQQTTNLEDVSVRELKAKIDDLKKANDRLLEKVDESEKKAAQSRKSEEAACGKLSILQTDTEFQKRKIAQLESEISKRNDSITALECQITDLENRPVEVAVADNSAEVDELKAQILKLETENMGIKADSASEIAEIKNRNEKLEQAHKDEIESLTALYEKKLSEVKPVESVVDTKGTFKAYLSLVIDATNRAIAYTKLNPEKLFKDKLIEYFERSIELVRSEQNG